MNITICDELKEKGVKVAFAVIKNANIVNKNAQLELEKKEFVEKIDWLKVESSTIFEGYQRLYSDKNEVPPALAILKLIKKNGRFPNINTVVDSYNLISAKTFFSIGAHDVANIRKDIQFIITTGQEKYTPLGSSELKKISSGTYAAVDDEKVICYLDQKQCDETKITKDTKEFLIYVQGNENTSQEEVEEVLQEVIKKIVKHCGGTVIH